MPRYRKVALLVTAATALLLVLIIPRCSDDDDNGSGGDNGTDEGDDDTPTAPAADGSSPPAPDLSQELATAQSSDGHWEVVVNELRQEGDQLTVWLTFTNLGEDDEGFGRNLVDPTLREREQAQRSDVSGIYVIDWAAGKAYYPMTTDQGEVGACVCSKITSSRVAPDESLAVFAVYNGVGDLQDASIVVPGFLPADGLAAS